MAFNQLDTLDPAALLRPYGQAEKALGHLSQALASTPLHATWLWREITRAAVVIAQAGGYQARVDQLRLTLIGVPLEREEQTPGLAAAKRIFLTAAPLFRSGLQADSKTIHWPAFWDQDDIDPKSLMSERQAGHDDELGAGEGAWSQQVTWSQQGTRRRLVGLIDDLAGFADDGRRPALINLLVDLRKHAGIRRLPASLVRIALPLSLLKAGLVPRAAPGLLGGRRLALGMSRAGNAEKPLTPWLALALGELAREAGQSQERLAQLASQHQAWHRALAAAGLRRHARAPAALDLLAATPVVGIGVLARHLGCSHVAAGKIVERLVDLGILQETTSRSRHKVFVAGDLTAPVREGGELEASFGPGRSAGLVGSEPAPAVDRDALNATLDGLFGELDRLGARAKDRLAEKG